MGMSIKKGTPHSQCDVPCVCLSLSGHPRTFLRVVEILAHEGLALADQGIEHIRRGHPSLRGNHGIVLRDLVTTPRALREAHGATPRLLDVPAVKGTPDHPSPSSGGSVSSVCVMHMPCRGDHSVCHQTLPVCLSGSTEVADCHIGTQ